MINTDGNTYLLVFTNPTEGNEDEYNDWYTNTHIRECVQIDGILAAQRFRLCDHQVDEEQSHRYAAIYVVERGREAEAVQKLEAAVPSLDWRPDLFDVDGARMVLVEPVSDIAVKK